MYIRVYKIIFDGIVDDHVRDKIDDCIYKDFLSGINSSKLIGVKYYTKPFNLNGYKEILQIWALNQDQEFIPLKPMYYMGAKLIIFVKSNNSTSIDQLFEYVELAEIDLDRIVLIENTKAFTENFFDFVIIFLMYKDGLISESEFQTHKSVYEELDNPKFILAKDLLELGL
ncbi:MAG: hypothetical protein ACXAEX_11620 [Promethearchaeota archaeon]|jgi:hypothetical protein